MPLFNCTCVGAENTIKNLKTKTLTVSVWTNGTRIYTVEDFKNIYGITSIIHKENSDDRIDITDFLGITIDGNTITTNGGSHGWYVRTDYEIKIIGI